MLRRASGKPITQACRSLAGYCSASRWLGTNNRYRQKQLKTLQKRLERDARAGQHLAALPSKHLAELLAASALLHAADGWSFLGRAVGCLLRGDADSCRHLGYYAELRAALSVLNCSGIGVFNWNHFIINSSGIAEPVGAGVGTHVATWEFLETWAETPAGPDLLARAIRPSSTALSGWLSAFPHQTQWTSQGKEWFQLLGLDLERLARDRTARNEASYRPGRLHPRTQIAAQEAALFARELWRALEPAGRDPFEYLDRHFLRVSLENKFLNATNRSPRQAPGPFAAAVDTAVDDTIGSYELRDRLKRFLRRETEPNNAAVIARALGRLPANRPQHHLEVLARGAILLRIATGAVRRVFAEGGIELEDLRFWWVQLGEDLALWEGTPSGEEIWDIWADIERALDEIENWQNGGRDSFNGLTTECGTAVEILGRCELAGIWGLAA